MSETLTNQVLDLQLSFEPMAGDPEYSESHQTSELDEAMGALVARNLVKTDFALSA